MEAVTRVLICVSMYIHVGSIIRKTFAMLSVVPITISFGKIHANPPQTRKTEKKGRVKERRREKERERERGGEKGEKKIKKEVDR